MIRWFLAFVLLGCSDPERQKTEDSGDYSLDTDDTATPFEGFNVMADGIGEGVLLSAWSDGDEVIFVGGDMGGGPGVLARYDGTTLCTESNVADRALWWIHGPREGEWYAVGEAGRVVHSVDGMRTPMDVPTEATLFGVWATETSVIAVGGHTDDNIGEIWRWDGMWWTPLSTDLPGTAFKIYENWVVGMDVLIRIDGDELVSYPAVGRLLTARGRAADDIWAVGGLTSSLVAHFDGSEWSEVDSTGVGQPLNGVWTAEGEDVWVAGNFGTTLYWDGDDWQMPELPISSEHFHAVWKHGDEVFWAGGNLFSPGDNYGTIARYGDAPKTLEATPCD